MCDDSVVASDSCQVPVPLNPTFRADCQILGRLHDTVGRHSLYVALHKCH